MNILYQNTKEIINISYNKIKDKIINIFGYFNKYKICGGCDKCGKLLYNNTSFLEMDNCEDILLNIQFCSEECYKKTQLQYKFLEKIKFRTHDSEQKCKDSGNSLNMSIFIYKYPWTVTKDALFMYNYINNLTTKINKTEKEKVFLEDSTKYKLIKLKNL